MKTIILRTGEPVLVDDEDFDRVSRMKWRRMISTSGTMYAMSNYRVPGDYKRTKTVMMHRIIMNAPHGMDVDHRDGNGLDNRKQNLRLVTGAMNLRAFRKKGPNTTSKYMGVSFSKKGWEVKCSYRKDGVLHKTYVGLFKTEIAAALAYNEAAIKYGYLPEALNQVEAA